MIGLNLVEQYNIDMKTVRALLNPAFVILILLTTSCTSNGDKTVSLEAGKLELILDMSMNGGVVLLGNDSVNLVSPAWTQPTLFAVGHVIDRREELLTSLDFEEFSYSKTRSGLQLHYSNPKGQDIQVTISISVVEDHFSLQASVDCGSSAVSSGLYFPYFSGYESLSGNPEEDYYLAPHMSGQLFPDPARTLWGLNRRILDTDGYPGSQGMQFNALYNEKGGVMVYTPDTESHPKRFDMMKHRGDSSVALVLLHYFDETPGFAFETPYEIRLSAMGGSWYDAADIYAGWGRNQAWMEKKTERPDWLDRIPIQAAVHNNENWLRCPPAWYAEHQPEMDNILGPRDKVASFLNWEHYAPWIAPDAFPPLGGEVAMIKAAGQTRERGSHLKHLYSCSRYWMHEDITDEYFDSIVLKMAAIQRWETGREDMTRHHNHVGDFVITCPGSADYRESIIAYAAKVAGDYHHDFMSMDIWPASQPVPCHNPEHGHPPGLGRWYVEANLELVEGMQEAVFEVQPGAVFGAEGMAEPYMPYLHAYLMRSASAPLERDQGRIVKIRVPMFDYVYGDQFVSWEGYSTTRAGTCRAETALQFVRGKMMHISDRWHPKYFNIPKTVETGMVTLREDVVLGDDEVRRKDLKFAAALHDFQNGEFNEYFSSGRTGRIPEAYAFDQENDQWNRLKIYDLRPAVGVLQLDEEAKMIWVFGNGWEEHIRLRMKSGPSEMLQSTLKNQPEAVDFKGAKYLEIQLSPLEFGAIEWEH